MNRRFWLGVTGALVAAWALQAQPAEGAVAQLVQSGTPASPANGITTVTITSVDTTKSVLFFSTRHNGNRTVNSQLRGRLAPASTIEFERVTNEVAPVTIDIQWYLVTFGSGVTVQRGEVDMPATTVNVGITAVGAVSRAFVLWSKTPSAADQAWGTDDPVLHKLL